MKDCQTCRKRPKPGTRYEDTECARCRPWEPEDDNSRTVRLAAMFFDHPRGGRVHTDDSRLYEHAKEGTYNDA